MMSTPGAQLTLVVIPNDPIHLYEEAGYEGLADYFNPGGMFDEVIALSPRERGTRRAHGMTIRGVDARHFKSALAEIRPNVVRAYAGDWPADLACRARLPGVPIVVSVHDLSRARMHDSLRGADMVICTSEAVAERVRDAGVAPNRIRLLPNRVDTRVFRPDVDRAAVAAIAQRFAPGRYLLHIGRKVEEKNLDTVIRALAWLPPEYSCVFVGRGDSAPYVRLADTLGVGARCTWIDAIRNSELPAWYAWCDAFCVPSRSEGFGTVFIEAAACGAAIVTSNLAPMNRYLAHGESAHLVDAFADPEAIALAVREVCENSEYRARITRGAVTAAGAFDKRLVDAAEVRLYREALDLPPRPAARHWQGVRWRVRAAWRAVTGV
jgi:glycosyltransferase involved in cell wall biosynthesis